MADINLGPKGEMTLEAVKSIISTFKNQQLISADHVSKILDQVEELFKKEKNVVEVSIAEGKTASVFGNIAGQYYDMLNMFDDNGMPSEDNISIFAGNFVDRGYFSVETIVTLFALKVLYPSHVILLRGNHECAAINKIYGFCDEMKAKYGKNPELYSRFNEVFNHMPLAGIVSDGAKKVFIVHGGLSQHGDQTMDEIQAINTPCEVPEQTCLMQDLLWADPHTDNGFHESPRGAGICWGPDISQQFLQKNGFEYMIRAHILVKEGMEKHHNGQVITIWSAPNYCGQCGNKGGFIKLTAGDMKAQYKQFEAIDQPKPTWEQNQQIGKVPPQYIFTSDNK